MNATHKSAHFLWVSLVHFVVENPLGVSLKTADGDACRCFWWGRSEDWTEGSSTPWRCWRKQHWKVTNERRELQDRKSLFPQKKKSLHLVCQGNKNRNEGTSNNYWDLYRFFSHPGSCKVMLRNNLFLFILKSKRTYVIVTVLTVTYFHRDLM